MTDIQRAADAIMQAQGLLVCAGAGMGVDSGLPDFRGNQGFWNAYPHYGDLKLSFSDLANPEWFEKDPSLAWGFYGHRLNLYRKTEPHRGFKLLLDWAEFLERGVSVFTSNVDGHFQKAGYKVDRIVEAHGTIHYMQCLNNCGIGVFSADSYEVSVDEKTFRAREPLPRCPRCGAIARPNILMFNDSGWSSAGAQEPAGNLQKWLREMPNEKLVVIECGAGTAVPTVRFFSEQMLLVRKAKTLIRINPREFLVSDGQISIPTGALQGLSALADELAKHGR